MHTKQLLLPAAILASGVLIYSTLSAQAVDGNPRDQMVSNLAGKLGISEDKVTAAFDDLHEERQAEMKTRHEERLQSLVDEGKMTAAQKDALLSKMEEMRGKHEALREEFETWATGQGINLDDIGPFRMKFGGPGMRGGIN